MKLTFHAGVRDDVDDAYRWYQNQRPGLGDEFLSSIEQSLEFITQNPAIYGEVHRRVRAAPIRRFPYVIYYRSMNSVVEIVAIQHGSRNPRSWRRRL